MSKHTPGPWVLNYEEHRIDILGNKHGGTFDRVTFVANAWTNPGKRDQALADARLIAAAPELLEALKHILEMRGAVGVHNCPGFDCSICTQEWGRAEAAIAKAEGRS